MRARTTHLLNDARTRAVIVPYVLSRAIVLLSLTLTRRVLDEASAGPLPLQARMGLLGWDAAWYRDIADGGYGEIARVGLRFFPLFPMISRGVSWLPGVDSGLAVLLVANACALAVGFLVYELVWRERDDADLARRAVWIVYLAPSAFVLVMGYAEALFMIASLVALLALRNRLWWLAAAAGMVGGLTRPLGALLVLPALVEVYGMRRTATRDAYPAMAAAVAGPAIGIGSYLLWVRHLSDGFFYPLNVQQVSTSRGGFIDPFRAVARAVRQTASGDHLSAGIHVVTAVALVVLIVVLWRRWPASFTAYALAAVVVGLSARNLDSLERYSLSTVPLALAAADICSGETRERVALAALAASLVGCSALAFSGVMVP